MKILITGATGLIGQKLGQELVRKGHQISVITRSKSQAELRLSFPAQIIESDLVKDTPQFTKNDLWDVVVHLAGENIGEKRWSKQQKQKILDSRILTTQNLLKALKDCPPKIFVGGSAVGIYLTDLQNSYSEESTEYGSDFLAEVCKKWEAEYDQVHAQNPSTKLVKIRTGIVLSSTGGALEKMLDIFKLGLGGKIGNGNQWMSWIHIDDLVQIFCSAIENKIGSSIINAVAPEPVQQKDFAKILAEKLGVCTGPSVPELNLKLLLGEMSALALSSQNIISKYLSSFNFKYPTLDKALENICESHQNTQQVFMAEQFINKPLEQVFEFFSAAENLEKITPDTLNFKILKKSTESIQKGTLIDYQLKIHGVPAKWKTEICEWSPPYKFADNQLKGPYQKWYHTHTFETLGSGTLMRDIVCYKLPMGKLGWIFAGAFVRADVQKIFGFRRQILKKFF